MKIWSDLHYKHFPILLLILFGILLFPSSVDAQKRKSNNSTYYLQVQGGYLWDIDAINSESNYSGFNYYGVGAVKKGNTFNFGIGLEFNAFSVRPQSTTFTNQRAREKKQVQASLFMEKRFFDSERFGSAIGPLVVLGYRNETIVPFISTEFPIINEDIMLGLGLQLQNHLAITEKIAFVLGGRIVLGDVLLRYQQIQNPVLPIRLQKQDAQFIADLIRPEYLLNLGIRFQL